MMRNQHPDPEKIAWMPFFAEESRLFPFSELPAFVEFVVMDEVGISPPCPTSRSGKNFIWKDAYGNGNLHIFGIEKNQFVLGVFTLLGALLWNLVIYQHASWSPPLSRSG